MRKNPINCQATLASAIVAGYAAIDRLLNPQPVTHLGWLVAAGIVGFIGNEAVAVLRINVGRRINSATLIADGYHARTDGLTSLAVVGGTIGVWLGFPLADPIIGLIITAAIFGIVWQSARAVLTRMLDGVEPATLAEVHYAAAHVKGIVKVARVRGRWIGHRLHLNIELALHDGLLLGAANSIAEELRGELAAHIPGLEEAVVSLVSPKAGADHSHHHAPKPFRVDGKLASGLLEIVDTPDGERMRLRLSRHATDLSAEVAIDRADGANEVLMLMPAALDHHVMESAVPPAEPHEFTARPCFWRPDRTSRNYHSSCRNRPGIFTKDGNSIETNVGGDEWSHDPIQVDDPASRVRSSWVAKQMQSTTWSGAVDAALAARTMARSSSRNSSSRELI